MVASAPVPAFHASWTVLPHGPLEAIADNVWRVEGDIPDFALVKRVMVIARRASGELVVHNAIALDHATMARIDELGPVRVIIVPNGWHRLDAHAFRQRYPDAAVYCPRGARKRVAAAVTVDGAYEEFPGDATVTLSYLPGVKPSEGLMTVRSADGVTLVFNDLINNLPRTRGFTGAIYHVLAGTGRPRTHRVIGFMLIKNRAELHTELQRLADLPDLRRVIVAHGAPALDQAGHFLRTATGS
jgi:hypothetical protein